jgi:acyl-CoA synthetase (AMP-forming)/AMP-acid ligase II
MKFPEKLNEYKTEIMSYIESPMFFVFDNELVNMYEYLSRLSDSELSEICKDDKFTKMCDIVTRERAGDYGDLSMFVNKRGMLNTEGLLPILSSFPSFNDAMNFIMRIKPGFRYTKEFQKFVEDRIIKEETVDVNGKSIIRYTLDRYKYEIHDSDDYLEITYYRDNELHRINGPAVIVLVKDNLSVRFSAKWYKNGKQEREELPAYLHYDVHANTDFVEQIYRWYENNKKSRQDGPAVIKILKPLNNPITTIRNSKTMLAIRRDSEGGEKELQRRNENPKHIIIKGDGDSIVEEYWRNGEKIYV